MILLLRQTQQQAMTNIIAPVKAVLQHHHRGTVAAIQPKIAGEAADKPRLIKNLLAKQRVLQPAQRRSVVAGRGNAHPHRILKRRIQRGIAATLQVRLRVTQQIAAG